MAEEQTSSQSDHKLLIYRLNEDVYLYIFFDIISRVSLTTHCGGENNGLSGCKNSHAGTPFIQFWNTGF